MGNKMGNKKKNKIENKIDQTTLEFNVIFIGEFSYFIELIERYQQLKMLAKSKNSIILDNNINKIKLNLIDIDKKDKNLIIDCIIMLYDINDDKSFEDIKLLWEEKLYKIDDTNLIYLIGIQKDSNEEKTKPEATKFCENNIIKFFIISDKKKNDIKTFINNLLEQLGKRNIIIKNNNIKKPNKKEYKVCFLGSSGNGAKTCLINAIMGKKFDSNSPSTTSASFVTKTIQLNNENIDLYLWDNVGQEAYRSLSKIFIINSDCIVIGFSIESDSSFEEIRDWYKIAKENCDAKLMYLIGNKIDLKERREVNEEKARNLAIELNLRYLETSCFTGEGVYNFVYDLANEIIKY